VGLSRFEGKFEAAAEAPLDGGDIFGPAARNAAIACYLAAGDGWREAAEALGHAFACGVRNGNEADEAGQDKQTVNQRVSEYLQRRAVKRAGIDND
jgi:hypothetical protein